MRVILQRVTHGRVTVEGHITGEIETGFVALVGVTHDDTEAEAHLLAKKTANLRVFPDNEHKMNLSVLDCGGGVLVISQFTLYADTRKGRRPSFVQAAAPEIAAPLVDYYADCLRSEGIQRVEKGVFGAMMLVQIHNNGPVTIILDSKDFTIETRQKTVTTTDAIQHIRKAIRSLEQQVTDHQQKLSLYQINPEPFDNREFLKNAVNEEMRLKIIAARVRHLQNEIDVFKLQIDRLRKRLNDESIDQ